MNSLARDAGAWALAGTVPTRTSDGKYEVATFAGGCFWGTELHFQRMPGVVATCVGYTQGAVQQPNYQQVCSGSSGHTEGIQLAFDPDVCRCVGKVTGHTLPIYFPPKLPAAVKERPAQRRAARAMHPYTNTHSYTYTRSYEQLCEKLLSTVDPTLLNGVGNDRGTQYRHGVLPSSHACTHAKQASKKKKTGGRMERRARKPTHTPTET